jgi:hypothetical protein
MQSGPDPFGRAWIKPRMCWESAGVRATVTAPEVPRVDTDRYPVSFMADKPLGWVRGPDPAVVHATARPEIVRQVRTRVGAALHWAHCHDMSSVCPRYLGAAPGVTRSLCMSSLPIAGSPPPVWK